MANAQPAARVKTSVGCLQPTQAPAESIRPAPADSGFEFADDEAGAFPCGWSRHALTTPDIKASTHAGGVKQAVWRSWRRLNARVGMVVVNASDDVTNPRCARLDRHQSSGQAAIRKGMRIDQPKCTARCNASPTARMRSLASSFDEPRHQADDQNGKDDRHPGPAVAAHPIADTPHATVHHGFAFLRLVVVTKWDSAAATKAGNDFMNFPN